MQNEPATDAAFDQDFIAAMPPESCRKEGDLQEIRPLSPSRLAVATVRERESRYNLPPGSYKRLMEIQEGRCAICREYPLVEVLFIDHCHATGAVRGLLCRACNTALGWFGDNTQSLANALEYLESPPVKKLTALDV